jgi:hypothetical protein
MLRCSLLTATCFTHSLWLPSMRLDMMEVGNLKSFVEDRTHFGMWAIISRYLIH